MYRKLFFVLLASLFLSTVVQAAPPPKDCNTVDSTNLIGWWKLDETSGTTAADSKGGDNNGTLSNGQNTYAWGASGKFSTALTMGTSNTTADARVAFPITGMTHTAGTLAMWAKLATQPTLLSTGVRYFTGWQGSTVVATKTADRVQLYLANISNEPEKITELCVGLGDQNKLDQFIGHMNVGEWYHVALTWTQTDATTGSGTYIAYLNGIDMPSGTMAGGYTPGNYKNLKSVTPVSGNGGNLFNNQAVTGVAKNEGGAETLDEVGFYKAALTRKQICELAGADPNKAWNPVPDYNQIDIGKNNPTLTWSAGEGAASHDVYFGTDSANPTSQGNQTATTFGAGTLAFNTVYYWRIDERDGSPGNLTATGDLWKFKTVTGQAANPVPDNGSYNVKIPVKLAWKAGDTSGVTHDVYYGTDSTDVSGSDRSGPMYIGNQAFATTTYTPNGILLETRYYWRIDEVISYPTLLKGNLWTFTSSPIYYVDDFQTFTSLAQLKNAWKATGTANNAYIYQDIDGTDKLVRFWYDNATSPYYAGIKRSVIAVQGTSRDLTFGGSAKSLRVSYKVDVNNPALYVSLTNTASTVVTKVKQPITTDNTWQDTWFDIADFSTVTGSIRAVEIGDGNQVNPLLGQGFMSFDDIKVQAKEWIGVLEGDLEVTHDIDYKDVKKITADGGTWLATPVSLVKNGGLNKGTWGSIPSNCPDNGNDPCSVNWPKYWYLWTATSTTQDSNYVLNVETTDPKAKTCARIDLDGPTTTWNDGELRQVIDISADDFNGQELLVSFMHKGDITAQDNTMFEYRPCMDGCSTDDRAGPPMLKRVQRAGLTTCGDCYGALSWDWEPYTHIMTVNHATLDNKTRKSKYMHLAFRMGGRQDSSANPPMYLKIDSVVVKKTGDTLPANDITMDGVGESVSAVDFADFAVIANEWLLVQQSIP